MRIRPVTLALLLCGCAGTPACGGNPTFPPDGGTSDASDANDAGPEDGGDEDGGPPDGGIETDGGLDSGPGDGGNIVRIDWRDVHGDDLPTTTTELGLEELFAVTSGGVVLQDNCDAGPCDYRWVSNDGGVVQEGLHWQPPYPSLPVSPDGRLLHIVELSNAMTCDTGDSTRSRLEGTLRLVDIESGSVLTSVPNYATYDWNETHFTSAGNWFRQMDAQGACGLVSEQLRSIQAPYAKAPAYSAGMVVDFELSDGRWVAMRNGEELGTVVPAQSGSFESITSDVQDYGVGGGWVHAYVHAPVVAVVARDPQGVNHTWPISSEEEWHGLTGWGRWSVLYGRRDVATQLRPYRVHDMLGQYPDSNFRLATRLGGGISLLGAADLIVLTGADENGSSSARMIDLRNGVLQTISDRTFMPVPIGDGEAVVLYNAEAALLVERAGVTELASGTITEVYSLGDPSSSVTLPQRDLAFIVSSPETGRFALDVFNLRTRRMAALSDRLFWAPVVAPVGVEGSCGRPWVTRPAGAPQQSRATPGKTIFFAEYPRDIGPASLFVLPLDLSESPRMMDRMVPAYCHAPMQSVEGSHLAAVIEGYDTQPRRWIKSVMLDR